MSQRARFRRHIVVDMTPLEPLGGNGGAGLVATSLVRHLSALDRESGYTLLTADDSHAELAPLDAINVQRQCVGRRSKAPSFARKLVDSLLPLNARMRVKRAYSRLQRPRQVRAMADRLRPDLLFCPFTVPYFWQPGVPCISIVHDLQHVAYPEFFTPEQRLNRERHVEESVARSERVACVSEYVRRTLLASTDVPTERAIALPLSLLQEWSCADGSVLDRLALKPGSFLLYPSNFWLHKNHRRLFRALQLYRQQHCDSQLRLVCTGAPNALMSDLANEAPAGLVVFAGYVSQAELLALFDACTAMIFPSLYEGFGMPVLEALARGVPVLCSKVASLPEVAGDSATYFDPTEPREIASAIAALHETSETQERVRRGRERAALMGTGRDLAARYLELFNEVLNESDGP